MDSNLAEDLGIKYNFEEERLKFLNRIKNKLFIPIEKDSDYRYILKYICNEFGEDLENYEDPGYAKFGNHCEHYLPLEKLTTKDFARTLQLVEVFIKIRDKIHMPFLKHQISAIVSETILESKLDIGINWDEQRNIFLKSGDEFLDKNIHHETLLKLNKPNLEKIERIYSESLRKFFEKDITFMDGCHSSLEKLFQIILNKPDTGINKTFEEIFRQYNIANEWKSITKQFIEIANNHYRHDSFDNSSPNKFAYNFENHFKELESFLYLTGVLLRLFSNYYTPMN